MDKQKIKCTVESCKYNDCDCCECTLKEIKVVPQENKNTSNCDESMCSSYKHLG